MAKNVALMALAVCCIFLVLVSHAEAQTCKSVNRNALFGCVSNLNSGQCTGGCKTALSAYKNEPPQCICKIITGVTNLGYSKQKVKDLISNCKFGRTVPNC